MLNLRFVYGKPDVPQASQEITSEVCTEIADLQKDENWEAAVELVVKAGDPGVKSLAANDWYRLRRRLEIIKVTATFCNSICDCHTMFSLLIHQIP